MHLAYLYEFSDLADFYEFSDWKLKLNISKMLQCSDILLYNFPPKQT